MGPAILPARQSDRLPTVRLAPKESFTAINTFRMDDFMRCYFAPLEGVTSAVYRNAHYRLFSGVDKYYMPFISPTQHHVNTPRELRDILPEHNGDTPVVPQLLTKCAEDFLWAAGDLAAMGYDEVNLNLGCPSGTVVSKGKGSGFLAHLEDLERFLDEVFARCPIDISIKTRLGVHEADEFWPILELYNRYPIKELTIHPRVQKDIYKNQVRMGHYLRAMEETKIPLCYNGDLVSESDYKALTSVYPEIDTIMLGRGIVANPALARQIKGGQSAQIGELQAFHDTIYEGFAEMMHSRRNAMIRMKEIWYFHINLFDDGEKHIKRLRKASVPAEYEAAAAAIFRELPLRTDAVAGWR